MIYKLLRTKKSLSRSLMGVFALLLLVFPGLYVRGQQIPVYSSYFFNKYLINPAFTGIDNQYRAFGFYRAQWNTVPGHPITGGATAEASFWKDRIGIGGYVVNDRIGIFNTVNAAVSVRPKSEDCQIPPDFGRYSGWCFYQSHQFRRCYNGRPQ